MTLDTLNSVQDHGPGCAPEVKPIRYRYYGARSMNLWEATFTKFIALLKIAIIIPIPISTSARLKM